MVYEIEMKAHAKDPDRVRQLLDGFASKQGRELKRDRYFVPAGDRDSSRGFRIRESGGGVVCTYKDKRLENGLEVNREVEFEVSDAAALAGLGERLGCTLYASKTKHAEQYRHGDFHLELCLVEGLGWFVEIERLCALADAATMDKTRADILELFSRLEISPSAIEERTYTGMLRELESGSPDQGI